MPGRYRAVTVTVEMYWVTHFLALLAGGCFGAGVMCWFQINRMERDPHDFR